jgi:hypothetical protein
MLRDRASCVVDLDMLELPQKCFVGAGVQPHKEAKKKWLEAVKKIGSVPTTGTTPETTSAACT